MVKKLHHLLINYQQETKILDIIQTSSTKQVKVRHQTLSLPWITACTAYLKVLRTH